jgi:hypothetical protein
MVAVSPGKMVVKVDRRFGISEALRVRQTIEQIGPVRDVEIDFSSADPIEDPALLVIADLMKSRQECRFRLTGLTMHRRRLLRYMGVADRSSAPDLEPSSTSCGAWSLVPISRSDS